MEKLKAERVELFEANHALIAQAEAERRELTPEEQRQFDARHARIAEIRKTIDRVALVDEEHRSLSASAGRKVVAEQPGAGEGITATEARDSWVNRDGSAVRLYGPADRIATRQSPEPRGLGFGAVIRALVTGPRNDAERRALSEGTDSAGGFTVPDILGRQLIDRLRASSTVNRAGARTLELSSDVTKIARLLSDPSAGWRNENAAIAESDPTFEAVTFTPRSLAVLVKVSRELLDDSVNIESALMGAFAGSMAVEIDRVALAGTGTAPEPRGIRNTTNVNSVSMGANGLALANYDKLIDAIFENQLDNAQAPTAAIMHPRTQTALAKLKDTTNQPLAAPPMIEGLPFLSTTGISITDTQGTSTNASRLYVGNFADLFIGVRSELRVEVLRERFGEFHQYGFIAHLRADVQLAHPESFAQVIGIIP